MTTPPTPPEAFATLQPSGSIWQWIIKSCPLCGRRHAHGGGPRAGDPRRLLGHRVAHCDDPNRLGYQLVEAPVRGRAMTIQDHEEASALLTDLDAMVRRLRIHVSARAGVRAATIDQTFRASRALARVRMALQDLAARDFGDDRVYLRDCDPGNSGSLDRSLPNRVE